MNKTTAICLSTALALTGCGGSSGGAGGSNKLNVRYDISNYTAVESTSLTGTWVFIANGSESDGYSGYSDAGTFSKKIFLIIRSINDQLRISSCDDGFRSLTASNNNIVLPMNGQSYSVTDNNRITGAYSQEFNDLNYENYSFEMVKVSNDDSGLGTVSVDWSGLSSNTDFDESVIALCAERRSRLDSDGDKTDLALFNIYTEEQSIELEKGVKWGENMDSVIIFSNQPSFKASTYSEQTASVTYTDTTTAFTTTASGTSSTSGSASVSASVQLPVQ